MLARVRCHLSFANVVSMLALFVALGGGAYAMTLPRNSVGTNQLKKNAVTSSKIKAGAVTGSKVKAHSLLSDDFAAGQLPAGARGATGATGPKGDQGAPDTAVALGRSPDPVPASPSPDQSRISPLTTSPEPQRARTASAP